MQAVQDYVYKNYKNLKDMKLIINEFESHYTVQTNKDGSPLILSKNIV